MLKSNWLQCFGVTLAEGVFCWDVELAIIYSKSSFWISHSIFSAIAFANCRVLHTILKLSKSFPVPPSVSPSVCSCVTESVTPQQEVKEGELEAGGGWWWKGEGAKVQHKITPDRREQCRNVWQRKKMNKGKKFVCVDLYRYDRAQVCSNKCTHLCESLCEYECLCLLVCGHTVQGARQQQLGRPSSVLLSSINDQSRPSGKREPPNTRTWHWTKDGGRSRREREVR